MNLPDIKDCVLGNKKVVFVYFADQALWYRCENGFEFPVPVDDTRGGTFLPEDRASQFMRWIRKHLEALKKAYEEEKHA